METKRSYRQRVKRLSSFIYVLPIVTMLLSSQIGGCSSLTGKLTAVEEHSIYDSKSAECVFVDVAESKVKREVHTANQTTPVADSDPQNAGCKTAITLDHQHDATQDTVSQHQERIDEQPRLFVPYPVITPPQDRGIRASSPDVPRRCPNGTLRYCDHRIDRCACVRSEETTQALRRSLPQSRPF